MASSQEAKHIIEIRQLKQNPEFADAVIAEMQSPGS